MPEVEILTAVILPTWLAGSLIYCENIVLTFLSLYMPPFSRLLQVWRRRSMILISYETVRPDTAAGHWSAGNLPTLLHDHLYDHLSARLWGIEVLVAIWSVRS